MAARQPAEISTKKLTVLCSLTRCCHLTCAFVQVEKKTMVGADIQRYVCRVVVPLIYICDAARKLYNLMREKRYLLNRVVDILKFFSCSSRFQS